MAKPVARTVAPNGRARLSIYLPGDLRDRMARVAFEVGEPVSALVERAVTQALDAADAPKAVHEVPQAQWAHLSDGTWAASRARCPAGGERGALLTLVQGDGGWRWIVQAAGVTWQADAPTRTHTAAMLEAEALAATLTEKDAAEQARRIAKAKARR